MAYNYFPASYQPMMYQNPMGQQQQQPLQQPQLSQPVQNTNIVWVSGETGAKSYLLAPNTTLPLWDSEAKKIYLKSTDASGMPSMKILDYTIEGESNEKTPIQQIDEYATKQDVESLAEELATMKRRLDNISTRQPRKKEVEHE